MANLPILVVWPFDPFDPFFGIKAMVVLVLGLAMACWWAVAAVSGARLLPRAGVLTALWLAFACLLTVSTLVSGDSAGAVWGSPGREDGLLVWLCGMAAFATAAGMRREDHWRTIQRSIVAVAIVVSAFAVAQRFGFDPFSSPVTLARGRSSSTLRNPVFLGGYLVLVAPIAASWCLTVGGGWLRRIGAAGVLGVVVAGLYFTFSRAAWVGTTGAMLLLLGWTLWSRRSAAGALLATIAVALAVAAVLAILPHPVYAGEEQHSLGQDAATIASLSDPRNAGRLAIWEISVHMIRDHPWFGVGLDQMGSVFEQYRTERFDEVEGLGKIADRAHSDPLHLAACAGIPAALVFYAIVMVALLRSRRKWGASGSDALMWAGIAAGILGYLAQSLVSVTVPGVHTLFLLLLGGLASGQGLQRATEEPIELDPAIG